MSVDLRDVHGALVWMNAHKPDPLPDGWRLERDALDGGQYHHRDGLTVVLSGAREADGRRWLHVSCSRPSRLPSWDDLKQVKEVFVGAERYAYQVFPPPDRWVSIHPRCLHLWSPLDGAPPLPEFSAVLPSGRRTI